MVRIHIRKRYKGKGIKEMHVTDSVWHKRIKIKEKAKVNERKSKNRSKINRWESLNPGEKRGIRIQDIKEYKKRRQKRKDGRRYRRGRNSYRSSLIVKYRVSAFSAPQPETALIFKAFPWKQLPKSQFKPDLYPATSLPLPPLSPLLFSPSGLFSSLFVPLPLPLFLYFLLYTAPSLAPPSFLYLSCSKVLFLTAIFSLFTSCPLFSPWFSSPLPLSGNSLPVRPNYLEVSPRSQWQTKNPLSMSFLQSLMSNCIKRTRFHTMAGGRLSSHSLCHSHNIFISFWRSISPKLTFMAFIYKKKQVFKN